MLGFVSKYTNRLDAKGRVSIPAQFRAVLAKVGYEGLYCIPSAVNNAIDAGGNELKEEIEKYLKGEDWFSRDNEVNFRSLYEMSENLNIDQNGRVVLSKKFKDHAELTDEVTFVGQDYKFQLWNPKKFEVHFEEAKKFAETVRSGSVSPSKS